MPQRLDQPSPPHVLLRESAKTSIFSQRTWILLPRVLEGRLEPAPRAVVLAIAPPAEAVAVPVALGRALAVPVIAESARRADAAEIHVGAREDTTVLYY